MIFLIIVPVLSCGCFIKCDPILKKTDIYVEANGETLLNEDFYSNPPEALTTLVNDIKTETVEIGFVGVSLRGILVEEGSDSI